jgi:hypothetical protein
MSCWHGCGPRHHWSYVYGPPPYGVPRWRHRPPHPWDVNEEDLEEYLEDIESEVAQVKADLAALRRSRADTPRKRTSGRAPENSAGADDD